MKAFPRLLTVGGSAAWNMALDEALLDRSISGAGMLLRLYGWQSPAVSLGRFQDARRAVDLDLCRREAIDVVRRPTGGRAVFHSTDLTYSILFPESVPGGHSIRSSYALVSAAIADALAQAGIHVLPGGDRAPGRGDRADCFARAASSDLTAAGRKLVGSAQVRRGGWVLQQGSLRLWPIDAPSGLFRAESSDPACCSAVPAGLSDPALPAPIDSGANPPCPVDPGCVHRLLAAALARVFHAEWREDSLLPEERAAADCLERRKYRYNKWTFGGEDPSQQEAIQCP